MDWTDRSNIDELEERIVAEMARWRVPGLAIGVLRDGHAETRGYGVANVATGHAVAADTLFQVGSISKVFTATLVMILVEEGKLDLDAPVIGYVPDLRLADATAAGTITLRHLLTHTAGFYGDRFDDHGMGDDALGRAVAAFPTLAQQTAPGELWTYCNAGFDLAGLVIERVTGQPFETVMVERVCAPLGLTATTYFAHEAILHTAAAGHVQGDGDAIEIARPYPMPRRSNPCGGVISTVGDLLRFAQFHLGNGAVDGKTVLDAAAVRHMRSVQTDADPGRSWGLGWSLGLIARTQVAGHTGATNGFTARLTVVPDQGFALAVLTNGEHGSAAHRAIAEEALGRLCGLHEVPATPIALPEPALAGFAGRYRTDTTEYTLTRGGHGLRLDEVHTNPLSGRVTREDPVQLVPLTERVFRVEDGADAGALVDFILDGAGKVRFYRTGGRLAYPALP